MNLYAKKTQNMVFYKKKSVWKNPDVNWETESLRYGKKGLEKFLFMQAWSICFLI